MNLRTTETVDHAPPAVQIAADAPLVSNYPRGGFSRRIQSYEQGVARQALAVIGKHPFKFGVFGVISALFPAFWRELYPSIARTMPSPLIQLAVWLVSLLVSTIGQVFLNYVATYAMSLIDERNRPQTSILKSPQAWGASLLFSLVTFIVGIGSSFTVATLATTLKLAPFQVPALLGLLGIPIGVIVACRFVFAPIIAATRSTGVIGAFRESAAITQGVGLKAAGWCLLLSLSSMVATRLAQFNLSIFGLLGYLIPPFLYVVLGVWYTRRAWHWTPASESEIV